jgi:hypothetical protein
VVGASNHHVKQNKPDSERQMLLVFSHMQNLDLKIKDMKLEGEIFGSIPPPLGRRWGKLGMLGDEYHQITYYASIKIPQ